MAYSIPRLPCGCPANQRHNCGSGQRVQTLINLANDQWHAIAHARLDEALAGVPPDLRGGHVTLTFQWEAGPGLWPTKD